MQSPTSFSTNGLKPVRTNEELTAGITNIPLTYPAKLFFVIDNSKKEDIDLVYSIFEKENIAFERSDIIATDKAFIKSIGYVHSKVLKYVWRNFNKQLRPKFESDYRYCFWEIDTKDWSTVEKILDVYTFLRLPVYIHESMNGWHFLSVKPILKEKYAWFVQQVRQTNPKYPPITLRILPNKYVGEENVFYKGMIISDAFHSDTDRLKYLIEKKDINKLAQYYQIVWYSFNKKQEMII